MAPLILMPEPVSIIIPVYNEEGAISSTLAAVDATMRPTGRAYEVLVVDDGSAGLEPCLISTASPTAVLKAP